MSGKKDAAHVSRPPDAEAGPSDNRIAASGRAPGGNEDRDLPGLAQRLREVPQKEDREARQHRVKHHPPGAAKPGMAAW